MGKTKESVLKMPLGLECKELSTSSETGSEAPVDYEQSVQNKFRDVFNVPKAKPTPKPNAVKISSYFRITEF